MEQMQYNLLFRWFIGLVMDDAVRVPTVFMNNRERLIRHDAVIEFFNEVVNLAQKRTLLSGEHFNIDGTLIRARAGHKSFVRKDGDDQDNDGGSDAQEFIEACQKMKITPHVAQNTSGRRSAVADAIASSVGYAISQQKRKLIEQGGRRPWGACVK